MLAHQDDIRIAAIIVAGGRGSRSGAARPKQYLDLAGTAVLARTVAAFTEHPKVGRVLVVVHPDDHDAFRAAVPGHAKLLAPANGGATRQASVRAGLEALADSGIDLVLIHDAARPFVSPALIDDVIQATQAQGAAVPGRVLTESLAVADTEGTRGQTLDRDSVRAVQTPQGFRFAAILDAHRRAAADGRDDFTDDAAVAAHAGLRVAFCAGESTNVKLTTADDFAEAEARLMASLADIRTGQGFDVHAFEPGDHVVLGGMRIPHDKALKGHSDADVALHALTDAIFGALADGDIGSHFPPSDPRWKGADSAIFLEEAVARVRGRGGMIAHLDLTILGERPKIGPHRDAIRARIAEITGVPVGRIAVKATTTEQLGFTGREEGLAALASATIRLPFDTQGN